jgi:hypothetical protein
VARHIFRACPVWIYTQSNITNISNYQMLIEVPNEIFIKISLPVLQFPLPPINKI